jgi:hypothetical protein
MQIGQEYAKRVEEREQREIDAAAGRAVVPALSEGKKDL